MKILRFDPTHQRNDAHFQLHTEFRDQVIKETAEKLDINAEFGKYLILYNNLDEALKKISKSALTEKIHEADKARDDIWEGLIDMSKAALKHFSPEVQDAAKRLKVLFDTYGNVAKKTLNEETSAIYNILQELEGKYAADAAVAGIEQWVFELKARNNAFEALVKERFDETAAKTHIAIKDARKAIDAAYKDMCEIINVCARREGGAKYDTFINTMNAVIAKYAVRRHHHHSSEPRLTGLKDSQEETQTNVGNA